jgi:hypothetical protein
MPNKLIKQFHKTFATLAAAARAASSVDGGSAPRSSDLRTLGIDPAAFKSIQR